MKKTTAKAKKPMSDFYQVKVSRGKKGSLQSAALASLVMTCQSSELAHDLAIACLSMVLLHPPL
ncbi:hypothetical protein JCM19236_544 [Vibrio sp. JCM 19236]|nr:hypothetical protein JCM19236_544 [Vibrio sp. JCM 19236]